MAAFTYSLHDLAVALREARDAHRKAFGRSSNESDSYTTILELINDAIPRLLTIQDTMNGDGNYPWSDDEFANDRMNQQFPNADIDQVEIFNDKNYCWTVIGWMSLRDRDGLRTLREGATYIYSIFDLLDAFEACKESMSDQVIVGIDEVIRRNRQRARISKQMKLDGNYPWTELERANEVFRILPEDEKSQVHVYNNVRYIYSSDLRWLPVEDVEYIMKFGNDWWF